jgi:hypothetical protein
MNALRGMLYDIHLMIYHWTLKPTYKDANYDMYIFALNLVREFFFLQVPRYLF